MECEVNFATPVNSICDVKKIMTKQIETEKYLLMKLYFIFKNDKVMRDNAHASERI